MASTCDYLCERDGVRLENFPINEENPAAKPSCPRCQTMMVIKNQPPQISTLKIDDSKWEGFNYGLGKTVGSYAETMAEAKKKGLVHVGNDHAPSMLQQRKDIVQEYADTGKLLESLRSGSPEPDNAASYDTALDTGSSGGFNGIMPEINNKVGPRSPYNIPRIPGATVSVNPKTRSVNIEV